jgi:catechol 2,3-dioxygenase-like lactoylglutathione lyase family enzyme
MTTGRPVFDQFNLVVADMAATVGFYRLLGLEIPDTLPEWQDHHRSASLSDGVDLDFDSVEFARRWNCGWPGGAGGQTGVLGFRLASRDEVDATYMRMTSAGYIGQQPPYDAFWGARYAIIDDPDGNAVGLMSPADPARRRPLELP